VETGKNHELRPSKIFFCTPSRGISRKGQSLQANRGFMRSGASQDRPVIVGWSTAPRGQFIGGNLGQLPEKVGPGRTCCKERNHHAPNQGRYRVDHRTITGRRTISVHSKPACLCNDCPFHKGDAMRRQHFFGVGWDTERCRMAQATAPILDFTKV
jgi:hypothetical protein